MHMKEVMDDGEVFKKGVISLPQHDNDTYSSEQDENAQQRSSNNTSLSSHHKNRKYYVRRAMLVVLLLMSCTIVYLYNRLYQPADQHLIQVPKDIIENLMAKQETSQSQMQFHVEQNLWIFPRHVQQDTLERLYYQNNQYFAKQSGFQLKTIGLASAKQQLSSEGYQALMKVQKVLNELVKKGILSQLTVQKILLNLSLLTATVQKGGVMLSEYYCFTETFDWLKNITTQIHARRGNNDAIPQVFAFYDPARSSPVKKEDILVQFEAQKHMRVFPGLQPYFLVAKKNSKFTKALLSEIILILLDPSAILRGNFTYYGFQEGYNIYEDYYMLSVHRVLQRTQLFLDKYFVNAEHRFLALDYYGIYSINDLAAGRKFYAYFDNANENVVIESLSKRVAQDWLQMIGRIFQLTRLTSHKKINLLIQDIMAGKRDPMIKGSFLHRFLFPQQQASFIIDNPEIFFINETNQAWADLPKKIWVYWDEGIKNSRLSNQLCARTLIKRARQSGFQVNFVDQKNLNIFLEKEVIDRIQHALDTAQTEIYPQTKPDLCRLALLIAHGGIYLDASFLALTNFDWLVNIGRYPSKYIDNRYGHLPKVFMQYHPLWGGNLSWKINTTLNTKVQWQLPYQNNFIAAEKDNEFLKEWFVFLLQVYSRPYPHFQAKMKQMKMTSPWNTTYLVPMDALKYVIARKQREIQANSTSGWSDASEYYGIWSMNGYYSFQKYRVRNQIQAFNQLNNTMVYRYSLPYVQGYHGRNFHLAKFYGPQNVVLSDFILQNKDDFYASQAHPQSLFMTHMMDKGVKFYFQDGWKIKL